MFVNQERGKIGENLACKFLRKNNYIIIERNFRCKQGEIDIIACDTKTKMLVFVEVKMRTNLKYGTPAEAVNKKKQGHILSAASYYMKKYKINKIPVRIDVIEVYMGNSKYKIIQIKQAFTY